MGGGFYIFMLSEKSVCYQFLFCWQTTFLFLAFWSSNSAPLWLYNNGFVLPVTAVVPHWYDHPWFGLTLHCFFFILSDKKAFWVFLLNVCFRLTKWLLLSFSTPRLALDTERETVTIWPKINVLFWSAKAQSENQVTIKMQSCIIGSCFFKLK